MRTRWESRRILTFYLRDPESIRMKEHVVMGIDPPPDLAIEIVVSNPVRDALRVHARLGVPEVWVCKTSGLTILQLGEDRRYHPASLSRALPFLSVADLSPWIFNNDRRPEPAFNRAFRAWVTESLAPLHHRLRDHTA